MPRTCLKKEVIAGTQREDAGLRLAGQSWHVPRTLGVAQRGADERSGGEGRGLVAGRRGEPANA